MKLKNKFLPAQIIIGIICLMPYLYAISEGLTTPLMHVANIVVLLWVVVLISKELGAKK